MTLSYEVISRPYKKVPPSPTTTTAATTTGTITIAAGKNINKKAQLTFELVSGGLGEGEGRAGCVRGREEEAIGGAGQGKEGGRQGAGGTEKPAGDFF